MSSYMLVQVCRGRLSSIPRCDEPKVLRLVYEAAQRLTVQDIEWWQDFLTDIVKTVAEDLAAMSDEDRAEQQCTEQTEVFVEVSRWYMARGVYEAAVQLYVDDGPRNDVAVVVLDDKPWFVTGGMSMGDDPTEASPLVHLMSFTGLDLPLSELGLISDMEYLSRHVPEEQEHTPVSRQGDA